MDLLIESFFFPGIILFCIGMAGSILKRNIILSLICTGLMPLSIALLMSSYSQISDKKSSEELSIFITLYAALYMGFGLIFVINFFNKKKTIMTEDMKIRIE